MKLRLLCICALVLAASLTISNAFGQRGPVFPSDNIKRLPPPTPDYNCVVLGHPWSPVFQNLKGLALFVDVSPGRYSRAVECHGQEEKCADKGGIAATSPGRRQYIRDLIGDYTFYPSALHHDNLVRVFTEAINLHLQPYVVPVDCKRPPVIVFSLDDINDLPAYLSDKDILTVAVRLNIIQQIAVLSVNFYRPDSTHSNFTSQVLLARTYAIPTGLPEEQLEGWLQGVAKNLRIYSVENTKP